MIYGKIFTNYNSTSYKKQDYRLYNTKIIHNTIACNQLIKRIKIKESDICSICNLTDDIPHFFINCETTKAV